MNRRRKLFLLGLAFFVIMCISGIYSLSNEIINSRDSLVSTSAVEIKINEYNSAGEAFSEDGKAVMPGEQVDLIPKVENQGIECYIRAKLTYTINNKTYNVEDVLGGEYKNWTKKGDYYYYDAVLNKKEEIELFNGVSIPSNLSNTDYGKDVIINIVVEAIQSRNFDGDWDSVEIKKSVDRTYDINNSGQSTVIFENNANNYITLDDGFFDDLGNLLPGDEKLEEVKIFNDSNKVAKFYLEIKTDDLDENQKELLKNIKLVVKKSDGTIYYDTNLNDNERFNLGMFGNGEGENYSFEIYLPKTLDNEFSKILTDVTWVFSMDVLGEQKENPHTWDLKFDLSITVFLISAIGFIVVLLIDKKDTVNIENK